MKRRVLRPTLLVLALLAAPAGAHDHWVAPSDFVLEPGARVDLTLCVGHPSAFETQVRDPRRFTRFEAWLAGADGPAPVPGIDGRSPAGLLRPRTSGPCWIVFESQPAFVEIDAATYTRYLTEEGLDEVLREREARAESAQPGRDHYVRCDKTLLSVGPGPLTPVDRRLGLTLELLLETDPSTRKATDPIALRLEHEGAPVAGQQVKLMRLVAPHSILLARTDDAGRARFEPGEDGPWVATSVWQRRSSEHPGDWDSWWASLAFE